MVSASCDTFVALSKSTDSGCVYFAKNSDRPCSEATEIVFFPREVNPSQNGPWKRKYTYITIEFPKNDTYAVLLCKPRWMEGAEMGMNQYGLCIGNEAVFSKVGDNSEKSLLGMDILRIALETCKNAKEAVQCVTNLIETYGQGGICYHPSSSPGTGPTTYQNSFLIVDESNAFVVETVSRHHWISIDLNKHDLGFYSISNCLTIGDNFDECSKGFEAFARQYTSSSSKKTHVANSFNDFINTTFGKGRTRCETTRKVMADAYNKNQSISIQDMLNGMSHHQHSTEISPLCGGKDGGLFHVDVCMHQSYSPSRISQTTTSFLCILNPKTHEFTMLVTGTSSPCMSLFKPIWIIDSNTCSLSEKDLNYCRASIEYNENEMQLWWESERVHRGLLLTMERRHRDKYAQELLNDFSQKRKQMQHEILRTVSPLLDKQSAISCELKKNLSQDYFRACQQFICHWNERIEGYLSKECERCTPPMTAPLEMIDSFFYVRFWMKENERIGLQKSKKLHSAFKSDYAKLHSKIMKLLIIISMIVFALVVCWFSMGR